MKLISDFKDFYDGTLLPITEPNHKVWHRKDNEILFYIKDPKLYITFNIHHEKINNGYTSSKLSFVIFCGKLYFVLIKYNEYVRKLGINYSYKPEFIYNEDEINLYLKSLLKGGYTSKYIFSNLNEIRQVLEPRIKELIETQIQESRTPIIIRELNYMSNLDHNKDGFRCSINSSLKNIQFSKMMSDIDVAQTIDIYFNQQISTEIDDFKMSDKEKINSYGFDPTYGFRKRK